MVSFGCSREPSRFRRQAAPCTHCRHYTPPNTRTLNPRQFRRAWINRSQWSSAFRRQSGLSSPCRRSSSYNTRASNRRRSPRLRLVSTRVSPVDIRSPCTIRPDNHGRKHRNWRCRFSGLRTRHCTYSPCTYKHRSRNGAQAVHTPVHPAMCRSYRMSRAPSQNMFSTLERIRRCNGRRCIRTDKPVRPATCRHWSTFEACLHCIVVPRAHKCRCTSHFDTQTDTLRSPATFHSRRMPARPCRRNAFHWASIARRLHQDKAASCPRTPDSIATIRHHRILEARCRHIASMWVRKCPCTSHCCIRMYRPQCLAKRLCHRMLEPYSRHNARTRARIARMYHRRIPASCPNKGHRIPKSRCYCRSAAYLRRILWRRANTLHKRRRDKPVSRRHKVCPRAPIDPRRMFEAYVHRIQWCHRDNRHPRRHRLPPIPPAPPCPPPPVADSASVPASLPTSFPPVCPTRTVLPSLSHAAKIPMGTSPKGTKISKSLRSLSMIVLLRPKSPDRATYEMDGEGQH